MEMEAETNESNELSRDEIKLERFQSLIKAAITQAKRSVFRPGQTIALVFTNGTWYQIELEDVMPITVDLRYLGLEGLEVDGINLTPKKEFLQSYSVHIQIPFSLVRCFGTVTVLESSGLKVIDSSSNYVIYMTKPSFLGWIFLLFEVQDMLELLENKQLAQKLGLVLTETPELMRRLTRLTVPYQITDQLKAVPSPIRVTESDVQEFLRRLEKERER